MYFYADDGEHGNELWRLRRRNVMKVNAVAAINFERFWEWPIDSATALRRLVVAATFLYDGNNIRLVQRKRTNINKIWRNPSALQTQVPVSEKLGSIAFTSVIFDLRTGEKLGSGTSVARSLNNEEAATLHRRATQFNDALTFKQVLQFQPKIRKMSFDKRQPIKLLQPKRKR